MGRRSCGTETRPKRTWRGAGLMGPFWGRGPRSGEVGQEGAARAGERQRPPRRGRGRCVQVRDSVRTVPGPVPAGRACAVCLRPRAGVRVCSLASVLGILPAACLCRVPWGVCVCVCVCVCLSVCLSVCTLGSVCVVCVCVCVCVCPNAPRRGLYNQRTIPPNERDHRNKRKSERNGPVHSHKGLGILSRVVPFPPAGGRQALALPEFPRTAAT